jgi:uncharacterized protein (TIGR04222 family)
MNTWGISGPDFLLLYIGLFIVTWVVVLAARQRTGAAGTATASYPPELGLYEAAMLNGGGQLALATAVCRLKEAGSVRLNKNDGRIVASGPLPADADPVEEWVYTHVEDSAVGAWDLLDDGPAGPVLDPIRDRLEKLGLMPTGRQTTLMLRQVLWFAPLLALGIARVIAGTAHHHPVTYLVMLMLLSVGLAVNLCRLPRRKVSTSPTSRLFYLPRTTRAGARALKSVRMEPVGDYGSPVFGSGTLAWAVAMTGLGAVVLSDAAMAATLGIGSGSSWWGGGWSRGGWSGGWSAGSCGGGGCGGGGGGCGG